jgi:WD40 repeat protein
MTDGPSFRFDVFLSHNSTDKPLVEALAVRLRREGIESWLDKWHLVPGETWQDKLQRGLAECATCAAFVGPGGFGSWQEEELRAAISRRVSNRARPFRVIPVLLPGVEPPERAKLPEFLTSTTWVEFRASVDEDEPFRRLVCGIRGVEPDVDPAAAPFAGECPYRGLEFFDFNGRDPRFFCGREKQIDDLLVMLRKILPTDPGRGALRFLAILGASGSGKSSLARAGLLPGLRAGRLDGSERWPIAIARPGREPLTSLATAINGLDGAAQLGTYDRVAKQADGERSLHVAARLVLGEPPRAGHLVVLVDQFEEVFTLCEQEVDRQAFIDNLLHAAKAPDGPAVVLVTMRADFLPKCAPYSALAAAVSARQYLVEPMRRDDLRRAIERPARLVGLEPEPNLADLLLDDAAKNPGSLPLLQFVLKELWARRQGQRLTITAYRKLGGMERAVANRADTVLAQLAQHGRGDIAKRIFLSLVKLGEGTEDTRRRARLDDLIPVGGDVDAVQEVLQVLTDPGARLVTAAPDGTVEVAHEALIRSWPTLRGWVDADREGARLKQRLDEAADEWARHDRDPGYLEHGPRLALARRWVEDHPGSLGVLAVDFLAASLTQERSEAEEQLARERDRAEQAEARERAEKKNAVQARKIVALVGLLALGLLVIGALFYHQRNRAEDQAESAEKARLVSEMQTKIARKATEDAIIERKKADAAKEEADRKAQIATAQCLAAEAQATLSERPLLALLLSAEAMHAAKPRVAAAEQSLRRALALVGGIGLGLHDGDGVVAFSPDGTRLATGAGRNYRIPRVAASAGKQYGADRAVVYVWDLTAADPTKSPLVLPGHQGGVRSLAFSPDGTRLASGAGSGILGTTGVTYVWDLTAADPAKSSLPLPDQNGGSVKYLAFSSDGKRLATGGKLAQVWDLTAADTVKSPVSLPHPYGVSGLAFSPDGKRLAAGDQDIVHVWDLTAADPAKSPTNLPGHVDGVRCLAFSPNGTRLATGDGGTARVWDMTSANPAESPLPFPNHRYGVRCLAFNPNGTHLATAEEGGNNEIGVTRVWDLTAADPANSPRVLHGHKGGVGALAFSPDGSRLATGAKSHQEGDLGVTYLWDLTAVAPSRWVLTLLGHDGGVSALAFSPDGTRLATAGTGSGWGVRLWDLTAVSRAASPTALSRHPGHDVKVVFSPDGTRLASYSNQAPVVLVWDLRTPGRSPIDLPGHTNGVRVLAFSPDGTHLATGGASDNVVRVWDLTVADPAKSPLDLPGPWSCVWSLAFNPDGKRLAAGGGEPRAADDKMRAAYLWDLTAADPAKSPLVLPGHRGGVWSLAFSPDGKRLATGALKHSAGDTTGAKLWDLTAADPTKSPLDLPGHQGGVRSLAFSPDGGRLATNTGTFVRLWNLTSSDPAAISRALSTSSGTSYDFAFSPDGNTLATWTPTNPVQVWNLSAADPSKSVTTLPGHADGAEALAFSPDGRLLATGDGLYGDGVARVWDLTARPPARSPVVLPGHRKGVEWLAFSPDGLRLVTGDRTGIARLWDLSGEQIDAQPIILPEGSERISEERLKISILSGEKGGVISRLAISKRGGRIAIVYANGDVLLHDLNEDDLMQLARRTAGRNLNREEWDTFFPNQPYRPTFPGLPVPPPAEGR